jgi:hypothetical protein
LDAIGDRLRASGWASFVTVDRLVEDWCQFADEAGQYQLTVDDYTNDLTARDGIELALHECPPVLRGRLQAVIDAADERFRAGTVDDAEGSVARYFRVDDGSGWWWKRRPKAGPLADFLLGGASSK